jgi:VanZ family protein
MNVSRWWPPVVWAAVVLTATSIPNVSLPGPSGTDKAGHFFMYGMLGFLILRAASRTRSARALLATLAGVAIFAALDEWHQAFIPGRSADVGDWVADVIGVCLGAVSAYWMARPGTPPLEVA